MLCGELYRYRYVEKLRREPGASLLRGNGPHKAAEANFTAQMKTGEPLKLEHVREISATACKMGIRAEGVRVDGAYEDVAPRRLAGVLVDESVALAAEYRTAIAPGIVPKAVELKVELPPSRIWPFTMVGVIDVIDDAGWIHDIKTKRKAPSKETVHESGQLTNYELLYRAAYGKPSAGLKHDYIWRTPVKRDTKSDTHETQRGTHQLARFVHETSRIHAALEAEVYIPAKADDWICSKKWCGYSDICPIFNSGKTRNTS